MLLMVGKLPHFFLLLRHHHQAPMTMTNKQIVRNIIFLWGVFLRPYCVHKHKLQSFTTSKTDRHLLRQKVRQRISVMKTNALMFPENWHFNSRFVLKTTITAVFVFITEIL